jgi:type IV secretion system protein VirD4
MLLPRTDPLREPLFTRRRTLGLITIALSLAVLAAYVLIVGPRITRWLELMDLAGWKRYVGVHENLPFVLRCFANPECQPDLLEFFSDDFNLISSLVALNFLIYLLTGAWMVWKVDNKLYRARFGTLRDMAQFVVDPTKEYVLVYIKLGGQWLGSQYNKLKYQLLDHILVTAPTGTGKSVHAKTVLGTFTGSVIVIDIKGELYRDTAKYRQEVSDVYRLNLVGKSARYNPLADIGSDELELRAAANLLVVDPKDNDPIFAQRAVSAVRAALLGAQLQNKAAIPYLAELVRLGPIGFIETLTTLCDDDVNNYLTMFLGSPPGEFLVNAEDVFNEAKGFLPSAWGTLVTRLEPFMTKAVLELMSGSDFSARELLQTETTVYLTFPERLLKSSPRVIALILEGLITGMARYADEQGGSGDVPCLIMMDEAPQYRIPSLPGYIATLRSRGISLLVYIQDEAQLRTGYQDDAQTIMGNCPVKLYWSPTDETAKNLSAAFGFRDVKRRTRLLQGNEKRVSETDNKRELMTADEITKIGKDDAFLRILGFPPVRGKRVRYFKERFVRRRLKR